MQNTKKCRSYVLSSGNFTIQRAKNNPIIYKNHVLLMKNQLWLFLKNKTIDQSIKNSHSAAIIATHAGSVFASSSAIGEPGEFSARIAHLHLVRLARIPIYNSTARNPFTHLLVIWRCQKKPNVPSLITYLSRVASDSSLARTVQHRIQLIKKQSDDRFDQNFTLDQKTILMGIVLGPEGRTGKELRERFSKSGLSHVLSVSGYNLSIVVYILFIILTNIYSKKQAALLAIGAVLFFCVLTGAGPSIIRATVMAVFALVAQLFGRQVNPIRNLLTSVILLLASDPQLVTSISFQLSVSATLGVLYYAKSSRAHQTLEMTISGISSPTLFSNIKNTLFESFQTTLFANLFTLPIILVHFQQLSVISPLSNALMLWIVPYLMLLSMIYIVFSIFLPGSILFLLAQVIKLPTDAFLGLANLFAAFPLAQLTLSKTQSWYLIGLSLLIIVILIRRIDNLVLEAAKSSK